MPRTVGPRRDSKHRVLHTGESIRRDGKYQFSTWLTASQNSYTAGALLRQTRNLQVATRAF